MQKTGLTCENSEQNDTQPRKIIKLAKQSPLGKSQTRSGKNADNFTNKFLNFYEPRSSTFEFHSKVSFDNQTGLSQLLFSAVVQHDINSCIFSSDID